MASFLSDSGTDIEKQITRLSEELASLRRTVAKRGAKSYVDSVELASDTYDELRNRFGEALPHIRRGAQTIERSARNNPAAAAVIGLVVIGLTAALLSHHHNSGSMRR